MRLRLSLSILTCLALATFPTAARAAESGFLVGNRENIVLLGDSITADGHYGQNIQDAVDAKFPERQIRVISRGSHGDTARGALQRVDIDVVQWRPAWVFINFGVNDVNQYSREEFIRHYEALLNRISRDTAAKIAIVSPIYQDREPEVVKMRENVEGLKELARKYDIMYVPLYETIKQLRGAIPTGVKYAVDGSHPNAIGYQFFSQCILQALKFPLDKKPLEYPIAWNRVTADKVVPLEVRGFALPLPQPVHFMLTGPNTPQAKASRVTKPIKLDGKLDEWNQTDPLMLNRRDQMTFGVQSFIRDNFRARAFTAYDDEAFYFAISVEDSVLKGAVNPKNVVDRDCVELCLDLRAEAERTAKPAVQYSKVPGIAQFILVPASPDFPEAAVLMGTGDAKLADGVMIASSISKLGYDIEVRIPKDKFPAALAPGLKVGLDFAVVNVDRNNRYLEAQSLRWTGSTASAFNTREFGVLTLN